MVLNVAAAVLHSAQSNVLRICVPTRFGIKFQPRFQKLKPNCPLNWMKSEPFTAPRAPLTVPLAMGTSNKSLYLYSLKVTGGGIQQEPSNGRIRGLNGHYVQRAVAGERFSSRTNGLSVCTFGEMSYFIWEKSCLGLLVQSGANDCDHKMGK